MPTNITAATAEQIAADIAKFGTDAAGAKALAESANRDLAALRAEVESLGKKSDPVAVAKIDALATLVETKQATLEGNLKAANDNIEALQAVNRRPGTDGGFASDEAAKEAKAAFDWHKARMANSGKLGVNSVIDVDADAYKAYAEAFPAYMRARSEGAMKAAFQAAMQTGSDPDGGYLVPTTTSSRIIKKVYETSNLRALATVETIAGKELEIPRDEGEFGTGGWVGETTAPSDTSTSQLGLSKIFAHEMYAMPKVTQNMLEDAGLDIEAWVANKVGEKFARVEATSFFTGTGVGQPRGLLTYATGTTNGTIEQVASGAAAAVTVDGLYNLVYQLKDYYTSNARFLMKRTTVRDILKLKDGEGRPIWTMGDIKAGQPAMLLDFPVDRCEDMPAVEASALAIAFGDVRAAYTIVDRLGITLLRDNLTAKPYVLFYNRRRVGGDVVNFEALKLQKISAA